MIRLMIANPLLLLFVVAAVGYPLGRIKIRGSSLGVAAVLFVGLAIGSLDPDLKLPEIVYLLGLVLFVYTIGLSSGPVFFASFRRKGLRDNLLIVGALCLGAVGAVIAHSLLGLKATTTAGLFAGSFTNTPALASVLETIKTSASAAELQKMMAEPVVGYSIAYPMGVLGMILAISLMQRIWKVDYRHEIREAGNVGANTPLANRTLRVLRVESPQETIEQLVKGRTFDVVFARMKRAGHISLIEDQTCLQPDDVVSVVGTVEELDRVTAYLGEPCNEHIELDRVEVDYRRIFVSNPKVAGRRLKELNLTTEFGAVVTRLRRGDIELLPHDNTVLELGDRVRVLTYRNNLDAVSAFFGDSYRALSEVDILTFSLGLALGLLLGIVPIPLPGGVVIKLGLAGGPLIVALILGALGRTGPLVWNLPYSANLTLRQLGLIFFLAGVGTRAGYAFFNTLSRGHGLAIFFAGMLLTCAIAFLALWTGYRLFKIPMGVLIGMLAGLQTQPAVLGYALEQTGNDAPNVGYASVYPVATIAKIVLAQILLTVLK